MKTKSWLPLLFMLLAALSRWPGLFPPNFSAFYGLMFCAGAFFPRNIKWWLPMGTLVGTDALLDIFYYHSFNWTQVINYVCFAGLIGFGTRFNPRTSFLKLLSGGILGACVFYVVTNFAAWLFNPFHNAEYTKDLAGLLLALTKGTAGYPTTLEFFWRTLLSGGLFTGLFVGAMKLTASAESAAEKEPQAAPEPIEGEEEPEEA